MIFNVYLIFSLSAKSLLEMPLMLCSVSKHVVGYNSFHVLTNYVNIFTVD